MSPVSLEEVNAASAAADRRVVLGYIDDIAARRLISEAVADLLRRDVDEPVAGVAPAQVAPAPLPPPRIPPAVVRKQVPSRVPTTEEIDRPVAMAPPSHDDAPVAVEPSVVRRWLAQARVALLSDLAVHGLAYLGVLLLFVGVFGLLYYSAEMRPGWRFVADVSAPAAFFTSGWFLHRRGASTVASALVLLGGAVTPIVAIASLTDGSGVPPDIHGTALPIVQASLCVVIAGAMWAVSRRHPESALRFVVAPTLWLAAGVLAGLTRRPIPTGQAVARASAGQMAAMLAAIAVSALILRFGRADRGVARATRMLVLPVAGSIFILELVLAASEQWAPLSGAIASLSALVILECSAERVPAIGTTVAQVCVVGVSALRSFQQFEVAWMGLVALVVLLVVTELTGRRRFTEVGVRIELVAVAAAVIATLGEPVAGLSACLLLTGWLLFRRIHAAEWWTFSDPLGIAPAVGLLGVAVESQRMLEVTWWVVSAAVVLGVSVASRWLPAMRRDRMWSWWVPVSATAVVGTTMAIPWAESRAIVSVASLLCAAAIAISAVRIDARVWLTASAVGWSLASLASVVNVPTSTALIVVAIGALGGVCCALALDTEITRQLGWMGHLVGAGAGIASSVVGRGWTSTVIVALTTTGWLATAVVHEFRGAHHFEHLGRRLAPSSPLAARLTNTLPAFAAAVGVAWTSVLGSVESGWVESNSSWRWSVVSVVAIVVTVTARFFEWRRADRVALIWTSFVGSLGAIVSSTTTVDDRWPMIAALAGLLAVVVLTAPPRPTVFRWFGWASTAPLVVLLARESGVRPRWLDLLVAGWGAAMLLAACVVDRVRNGRAAWDEGVRTVAARPPAALGALALVVGSSVGAIGESSIVLGWCAVVAAAVALSIALVRPLALVSVLTHAFLTVGLCLVIGWHPIEHPWSLVTWAAVLLVIAWIVRAPADLPWPTRWDLPAFWAGQVVVLVALGLTGPFGAVALTFGAASLLSFAVAFVLPHPLWVVVGLLLALVGAADLGWGWLALALAVEGVLLTSIGLARVDQVRRPALVVGTLQLCAAWAVFMVWREWTAEMVVVVTAPSAAVVSVAAALAIRMHRSPRDFIWMWAVAGAGGSLVASSLTFVAVDVDRVVGGVAVACALALLAVAAGVVTAVLGQPSRWVTVAAWAASATTLSWAIQPAPNVSTMLASAVALGVCVALLVVDARCPGSSWIAPVSMAAVYAQLAAVGSFAEVVDHRPATLAVMLLLIAGEVAAASVFLHRPELLLVSPLLAVAAWFAYAAGALEGATGWATVPVGFTLLAEAALVRWMLRGRGQKATGVGIAMLEYVGMSFLVGEFLVRLVDGALWYSLPALGTGLALLWWGAATRVRRRAGFGLATTVLAALLLVGVPLSATIPTWRGPALWLAVAGLGVVAIVVAVAVEKGRAAVHRVLESVEEATSDWEHTGGDDVWLDHHHR